MDEMRLLSFKKYTRLLSCGKELKNETEFYIIKEEMKWIFVRINKARMSLVGFINCKNHNEGEYTQHHSF